MPIDFYLFLTFFTLVEHICGICAFDVLGTSRYFCKFVEATKSKQLSNTKNLSTSLLKKIL